MRQTTSHENETTRLLLLQKEWDEALAYNHGSSDVRCDFFDNGFWTWCFRVTEFEKTLHSSIDDDGTMAGYFAVRAERFDSRIEISEKLKQEV